MCRKGNAIGAMMLWRCLEPTMLSYQGCAGNACACAEHSHAPHTSSFYSGKPALVRLDQLLVAGVARDCVPVELQAEARSLRNGKHSVAIEMPAADGDLIDIGRSCAVLDQVGARKGGCQLQIGCETNRRVPAVRNEAHAMFLGQPADAPLFADAADLGHIRLHNIEGATLDPWPKGLAAGEHFPASDRYRCCRT